MKTFVFDLDGVVYLGEEPIDGASTVLALAERRGHQVLFATNSSLRSTEAAAGKIERVTGFAAHPRQVVTSAGVAATVAHAAGYSRAYVVGGEGIRTELARRQVEVVSSRTDAEVVVVGLDLDLTYDKVRDASLAIRAGAGFIATNLDPSYPMPGGQWPGAGAIVDLVATASGVRPVPTGKPEQAMIDRIEELATWPIVMVGDRPSTDLAMAAAAGWESVLVLTGVTTAADEIPVPWQPTTTVSSIASLAGELE